MPRRNFNDGQELSYVDFNAIGPAIQKELYDLICYELVGRKTNAFFMDSFEVEFATSTSVTVKAGVGFQYDNTQVSPEPMRRLLYNAAQATKNLSAPDATHPRKDIVCVKAALVTELSGSRRYKDPSTAAITTETMVLQKEWEADIITVTGTPAASPVAPATPAGYLRIAVCTVNAVTGMSGASDVTDERVLLEYGANAMLDTSGFERITASANIGLGTVIAEVDSLLDDALDDLSAKTTEIAALKRKGIENWSGTATYASGDIVQNGGTGNVYLSLIDGNTASVSDWTYWKPLVQTGVSNLISAGSSNIDAQTVGTFRKTGSSSATNIGLVNMHEGQTIVVNIESVASQGEITWKRGTHDGGVADIKWVTGVAPITTKLSGYTDRYRFQLVNGTIYGAYEFTSGVKSVSGATTATCDCMEGSTFSVSSTGNITITVDHMQDGQAYNIYLAGAAARTVAWTLKDPADSALTERKGITYSNTMTSGLSLFTLLRIGTSVIINSLHGIA